MKSGNEFDMDEGGIITLAQQIDHNWVAIKYNNKTLSQCAVKKNALHNSLKQG